LSKEALEKINFISQGEQLHLVSDSQYRIIGIGQTTFYADEGQIHDSYDPNGNVTAITSPSRPVHKCGLFPIFKKFLMPPTLAATKEDRFQTELKKTWFIFV